MEKLNLAAPWTTYYKQLEALFEKDSEVSVVFDNENYAIRLYVESQEKAEALEKMLPAEKVFGNIRVRILVIPANKLQNESGVGIVEKAFKGNPAVSFIKNVDRPFFPALSYVAFIPRVVQFYNDDMSDINGNCNTLYQDIAKEVFVPLDGVCYCTAQSVTE